MNARERERFRQLRDDDPGHDWWSYVILAIVLIAIFV